MGFAQIIHLCRCSVGVNIINLLRLNSGIFNRPSHTVCGSASILARRCNVKASHDAPYPHISNRISAPRALACSYSSIRSMPAPSPKTKPLRSQIKRYRGAVRILGFAKRPHTGESSDCKRCDACLASSANHNVLIPVSDISEAVSNCIGSAGARRNRAGTQPPKSRI